MDLVQVQLYVNEKENIIDIHRVLHLGLILEAYPLQIGVCLVIRKMGIPMDDMFQYQYYRVFLIFYAL